MRVLLTGGSGFIGGALNAALNARGFKVLALNRSVSGANALTAAGSDIISGSITDRELINRAVAAVDAVFHLAGIVSHHSRDADLMEQVNVKGTENIIAALKNTTKRLVHVSSVAAVGALLRPGMPLSEEAIYNLTDLNLPYFETKRRAELKVLEAVRNGLIDAVIINPSTVFGARDGLKGSRKAHVKAVTGRLLACPDGGVSIASIEAVCAATIAALSNGRRGERYILGGDNISIYEMFRIIAAASGSKPPRFVVPTPLLKALGYLLSPLELMNVSVPINITAVRTATLYHWYSSEKAKSELGYRPLSAKEALGQSAKWILENYRECVN
jgi:dihydroflavonol-4-reductase